MATTYIDTVHDNKSRLIASAPPKCLSKHAFELLRELVAFAATLLPNDARVLRDAETSFSPRVTGHECTRIYERDTTVVIIVMIISRRYSSSPHEARTHLLFRALRAHDHDTRECRRCRGVADELHHDAPRG